MTGSGPEDFAEIAARYSAMMQALWDGPQGRRPEDERRMLVDRIRDALDRRENRLNDDDPVFIANTFSLEILAHRGKRSEIWHVRHRDLGTSHAIKSVPAAMADDPIASALLLREGKIGLGMRHGNIAPTRAVLRLADGRPALLMDWIGKSLADRLSLQALSVRDVYSLTLALLTALTATHDQGLVHCDIAPGNLLIPGEDVSQLQLADFGIALEIGHSHAEFEITHAGSPAFVSPEQQAGRPLMPSSDIYSLGRLIDYLLDHANEDAAGLRTLAGQFSEEDAGKRPADARSAGALLNKAMAAG
ncbi:protein kinase domain-containing protein [Rhizobium mongolense]|uniref:Type VI secretion system protein ImpN n=1 Tax=Rhizobium mongolense TaxID=57676 RepID=A0A7W6RN81_9HYPH|nr:protein kinase [Rhizobium mongolense]MBB4275621.1 type VI secretion system protein ImpN [Rhizobium mongolense]